jgi:hypothetical protein
MARASISIRVLDGGCSVWAVADIVFPFQSRPLAFRQPVELTNVTTQIPSIRSATQQNFYQARGADSVIQAGDPQWDNGPKHLKSAQ